MECGNEYEDILKYDIKHITISSCHQGQPIKASYVRKYINQCQ